MEEDGKAKKDDGLWGYFKVTSFSEPSDTDMFVLFSPSLRGGKPTTSCV